ncbi:lipopolysaccharide biosynthesis protein [Methanococcus vannielii]|uniref:lipopolysaccharide biosynthesis protein n=1 Tax=Methanococcus vannielii TaxID=2187 RepID=UPI001E564A2D|nr:oligosaccharide flippase family protein [Methanococcus vannielii]
MSSGTAIAQIIGTITYPIITRYYTPDEFGVFVTYSSIIAILSIISSLKYEFAIPIAESEEKAVNIVFLCVGILIIYSSIIFLALLLYSNEIFSLLGNEHLNQYWYLIPIGVSFIGIYSLFMYWSFRKKEYLAISKTTISQSFFGNISKIGFGFLNMGAFGLIFGDILGKSAGITVLSKSFINNKCFSKANLSEIIEQSKRYIKFPIYSAPSKLLNTLGVQLPVIFITLLYGSSVAGFFGLSHTIVSIPMSLIGTSVGNVFYGEAASIGRKNPKKIKELSNNLLKKLIAIGIIPLITLILFGPILFKFVFGSNWYQAGIYAQIIAFLVFFRFMFTPITNIFSVFERQKEELYLDSFRLVLVLIAFGISKYVNLDSFWAIGLYSLAMCIVYFVTYIYAQKILNDEIKKI